MIDQIEISNFRAFSESVTIRMRPLTILIGKNSAGKSTLIKLLLMIRQSLESRGGGFFPQFFVTEGIHVRLGAVEHLQNRNPEFNKKKMRLKLNLQTSEGPSEPLLQLLANLQQHESERHKPLLMALPKNEKLTKVSKENTSFQIEAELLYRKPNVGSHSITVTQGTRQLFEFKSKSLKDVRFLSFPKNTTKPEGELEAILRNAFLRPARELLSAPRHLSPVREDLRSDVERTSPPPDEVGSLGQHAYQHLYEILNRSDEKADFLTKSIRSITNIDSLEFAARARDFRSHFRGRNMDTHARCHLKDFGFGVSQCIPVFVQGVLLQRGQLLIVEQPEAQVHPTAQLELGTYFVELWKQFGVPSLVETHSANIILRLRQLVSNGELDPGDVSIAYFTIENRQVTVRNLDIYEDGRLEAGLEREFFGADVLELVNFGIPQ